MVHHRVQPTQDNDDEDANEASDRSDYEQVDTDYPKARKAKSLLKSDKITLELLILVDYFLLEKLNFNTQQTKKYVISFFNAVNLRFRSLTKPSVELYIAGIIVAETKSAFPFISENIEKKNLIDAASTLHDMGRYCYKDRWVPH